MTDDRPAAGHWFYHEHVDECAETCVLEQLNASWVFVPGARPTPEPAPAHKDCNCVNCESGPFFGPHPWERAAPADAYYCPDPEHPHGDNCCARALTPPAPDRWADLDDGTDPEGRAAAEKYVDSLRAAPADLPSVEALAEALQWWDFLPNEMSRRDWSYAAQATAILARLRGEQTDDPTCDDCRGSGAGSLGQPCISCRGSGLRGEQG